MENHHAGETVYVGPPTFFLGPAVVPQFFHSRIATAHNVFCYDAIAHILTPSVNLAFKPKAGFKNKCRARAGFGLGPDSGFKMRSFCNSVWVCMQGPTRDI